MARIDVELVAPFIKATHKTLDTMCATKITRKSVAVKKGYKMSGDISALIGMSGTISGTCAISLPEDLAVQLIESLVCEKVQGVNDMVVHDGVGELVNMIAGDAKASLSSTKYKFDITLPTIITGQGFEVYNRSGTRCVSVVFEAAGAQEFMLDITVPVEK